MSRLRPKFEARPIIVRVLAALMLLTAAGPAPLNASTLSPAREVDLSFLGKVVEPPRSHLVQFIGNGIVAVTIAVHNAGPPKLVRRGETGKRAAFVLHTVLVDVHTGRVLKESRWPTHFPNQSGFIATVNSKLFVLLGDHVAVASKKLELVKQLKLPGEDGQAWTGRASPSGRNAVFVEDTGLKPGTWAWVDLNELRVLRVWKRVPHAPGGLGSPISDHYVTFIRCLPGGRPPCKLIAHSLNDEPVRTVGGINLRYGMPEFVSNNLLLIHRWLGDTLIVNLATRRVVHPRGSGLIGGFFGLPSSAPEVSRFVVPAFSKDQALQYLNVYDGPTARERSFRIRGVQSAGREQLFSTYPWGIALSPDGGSLAYFKNFTTLLIFRLPPPEK